MENIKEYFAFISYSRKDKKVANWLHFKLENYEYPRLIVNESQRPSHEKYLRPIFLDTKDMQVEERPFTDRIKAALDHSRFLLLICSKDSAKSTYVEKEIDYFLKNHDYNYSLIVPLFIDEVHSDTVPKALLGTTIMSRHFPIYNMQLNEKSEANSYCFYQIAAYLLGVNFPDIYNRYEVQLKNQQKLQKKRLGYIVGLLIVVILALGLATYSSIQKINNEEELLRFEKKVFPAAVVFGYESNFISPVIRYLKEKGEDFRIYVLMPTSYRGLNHQDRIADVNYFLKKNLGIDSIYVDRLPTKAKRGSHIHRAMKDGQFLDGIYIDFASTTTSFFEIAKYKKSHPAYQDNDIDEIIKGYTEEFIHQTNDKLEGDSIFVEFVTSNEQLLQRILERHKKL